MPSINDDPSDELGEVDDILNGDNDGNVRNHFCRFFTRPKQISGDTIRTELKMKL